MAKKKGRRGNNAGSFNARARAQRERTQNEYYYDDYSDSDDDRYARHNNYERSAPTHDHYRGANYCPLCRAQAILYLSITEIEDKKRTDDWLFSVNWGIYGGFVAGVLLYYPSNLARDSDAHWMIRWPWIISWNCMAVSCLAGLFLKYYFIKPFVNMYDDKLVRTLPETINLRANHITQLERFNVKRLCWGVAVLFIIGAALAVAGTVTLVLGRFGTVLHGTWSTVKYIILMPLRFAKWVLRGAVHQLRRVVRLADRVSRATGRIATKSSTHLLSFAKLYGRTLVKFSRSLMVFVIDLAKLLLLTVVAVLVSAVLYYLYLVISGLIFGNPLAETPDDTHGVHGPRNQAPSAKPSDTPPPAHEWLNGDLPAGNLGKKNKQRRRKQKESVDAS